jgi:prefoldin subunit 5
MTNREDLARVLKDYQHLVNLIQELQDRIDCLTANIEVLQTKIYDD